MYELALFPGAGGGLLATRWLLGWRTACYVEIDAYCVSVLKQRIADGYLDDAPIWDDARTFDGRPWAGSVDIVTAGFPCQPFSAAGKQLAGDDERNLWPDTIRIIREVEPEYVYLENVPALLWGSHGYYGRVQRDLAEGGFDVRWDCIPASAVGANHQRDRLWVVAHAARNVFVGASESYRDARVGLAGGGQGQLGSEAVARVADANDQRRQTDQSGESGEIRGRPHPGPGGQGAGNATDAARDRCREDAHQWSEQAVEDGEQEGPHEPWEWWATEPGLARLVDGMASRMERVRASGQGQVPAVAATAWRLLARDLGWSVEATLEGSEQP